MQTAFAQRGNSHACWRCEPLYRGRGCVQAFFLFLKALKKTATRRDKKGACQCNTGDCQQKAEYDSCESHNGKQNHKRQHDAGCEQERQKKNAEQQFEQLTYHFIHTFQYFLSWFFLLRRRSPPSAMDVWRCGAAVDFDGREYDGKTAVHQTYSRPFLCVSVTQKE